MQVVAGEPQLLHGIPLHHLWRSYDSDTVLQLQSMHTCCALAMHSCTDLQACHGTPTCVQLMACQAQ